MTAADAGIAVAAGVVGIAVGCLIGLWGRRGMRQRLLLVGTRLDTGLGNQHDGHGPGLAGALIRLEHSADGAVATMSTATADGVRLRRALDAIPQGVVISDEQGQVVFRNSRATKVIGTRHGDALAAQAVDELLEQSRNGAPEERTLELYGPPRRTLVMRSEVIDDGDQQLGIVAVLDDVSDRRRLEAVRRDFVANVSHELKTPVGALSLLAETLLAENDPEVSQRLAGRIQTESLRVNRIIEDLLDLSRIEAEEHPPREPLQASLIMAEAVERVRSVAEQRDVKLLVDEPEPPVTLMGDRRQLVAAMHSLLENAVKYSDEASSVSVFGRANGGWVELVVRDQGIGIPARDLERIFERFYRVDHGRSRQTGGTGLGLSIVRHVANNHQGLVHVESREGEGSTFTLRLPVAAVPVR
ncbi:MAG TPA: ATP-binding protein [Acidimicrobiales bacterium]|nr:ATP-binding protein [Acidimicrobiales bacterium]